MQAVTTNDLPYEQGGPDFFMEASEAATQKQPARPFLYSPSHTELLLCAGVFWTLEETQQDLLLSLQRFHGVGKGQLQIFPNITGFSLRISEHTKFPTWKHLSCELQQIQTDLTLQISIAVNKTQK